MTALCERKKEHRTTFYYYDTMQVTALLCFNLFGCFVTLLALFLGQTEIIEASSVASLGLNIFGGLVLALGAVYGVVAEGNIDLIPFVILNATWTGVSLVNLLCKCNKREPSPSPASSTLPFSAFRPHPNGTDACEHDSATWKSIAREDDTQEWESNCELCGRQIWHMKEGWTTAKDKIGNVTYVSRWHLKDIQDMTEQEKISEKIF